MLFIAFALACLAYACHGRRLLTQNQGQHHDFQETIESLSNSHSFAELKQPQTHGSLGMLSPKKVLATIMLLLASVDPAVGWQPIGHRPIKRARLPDTPTVSTDARALHPVAMKVDGPDGVSKSAKIK